MSTAAPAPAFRPRPAGGYFECPNALAQNLSLLTRAELALALLVLRRTNDRNHKGLATRISDATWQAWTGLGPRMKELAQRGLAEKCLTVNGKGQDAELIFDRGKWSAYLRSVGAEDRAHTAGRKIGEQPKPGQKIHPACREHGCSLLTEDHSESQISVTPLDVTQIAKPVSRGSLKPGPKKNGFPITPLDVTQIAKPVSRGYNIRPAHGVLSLWPLALAQVRVFFPMVGEAFISNLAMVCSQKFPRLEDEEFAEAIRLATEQKKPRQKSEGLYLLTVPEALAALRSGRVKTKPAKPAEADTQGAEARIVQLARYLCLSETVPLRIVGDDLVAILRSFQFEKSENPDLIGAFNNLVESFHECRERAYTIACESLTGQQRAELEREVSIRVRRDHAGMDDFNRQGLKTQIFGREAWALLGLPDFSML